jgi:Rrf2 family protein
MFQISRRVDYAIRIMVELGLHQIARDYLPAREISRQTDVPKAFLHKITADLVRAGLVRTYSGPKGGLALARPTDQINMLHILEAIDGPVLLNTCLLRPRECPRDLVCAGHGFWGRMQAMVIAELQAGTLEKLVAESQALRKNPPKQRADIPYLFPNDANHDGGADEQT